jgi:hypothetical protein
MNSRSSGGQTATEATRIGRKPTLPEADVLARMVSAGLTHRQIAEQFGVTRQAVGKRLGAPAGDTAYGRYSQHMPWPEVSTAHQRTYVYRSLQGLVKRQLGLPATPEDERSLDTFLSELNSRQVLVGYDRERGWVLVPRALRPEVAADVYWTHVTEM